MKMITQSISFPVDGPFCGACRFLKMEDSCECTVFSVELIDTDFIDTHDFWRDEACLNAEKNQSLVGLLCTD